MPTVTESDELRVLAPRPVLVPRAMPFEARYSRSAFSVRLRVLCFLDSEGRDTPSVAPRTPHEPARNRASARCQMPGPVLYSCCIPLQYRAIRMDIHPAAPQALQINTMSYENTTTVRQDEEECGHSWTHSRSENGASGRRTPRAASN